jgi:polysaccharide pyruvyl transferase WcaK-like protein
MKHNRVVLFAGHLGGGNYGNDASLSVAVDYVRSIDSTAEVRVLGTDPARLRAELGLDGRRLYAARRPGRLGWLVGNVSDSFRYVRVALNARLVVIPGSGLLEDDLEKSRRFGSAYMLSVLSLTCFLTRTPFVLLGVGVSNLSHPLARVQARIAGRLAARRSFRDEPSLAKAVGLGIAREQDLVGADLLFSPPTQVAPLPHTRTVGVGVMQPPLGADGRVRENYLVRMTQLVRNLIDSGKSVELFVGDDEDRAAANEVVRRVGPTGGTVRVNRAATFSDVTAALKDVDVLVATRYHNVIAGIVAGRPTIALAYGPKSADVVARADSGPSFPAHSFDVGDVLAAVDDLMARSDDVSATVAARVVELRQDSTRILHTLDRYLMSA